MTKTVTVELTPEEARALLFYDEVDLKPTDCSTCNIGTEKLYRLHRQAKTKLQRAIWQAENGR